MSGNSKQRFSTYVDKYCRKHEISREEALTHRMVQLVKAQYEQDEQRTPGMALTGQ